MSTYRWTLTERATQCELNVAIEYAYTGAVRGRYCGCPEDCYPDEPASVEFESVLVEGETAPLTWDAACERFEIDEGSLSERVAESVENDCEEPDYEPDYERDEDYREGSFNGY